MKRFASVLVTAVFLISACKSNSSDKPKNDSSNDSETERDGESSEPAGSAGGLGMMSALFSNQMEKPGPYDPPKESKGFSASSEHAVILEFGGAIVDLASFDPLGGPPGVELRSITDALDELSGVEDVKAAVLRADSMELPLALAEELRAALIRFKASKKRLYCYGETLSTRSYFVFSACDKIAIAALGGMELSGFALVPVHLKSLLDKFKVDAQFVHIGDFKGAAEPLTLAKPSEAMKTTLGAILDTWFATLVEAVVSDRKIEKQKVLALIDEGIFSPERALSEDLVDEVLSFNDFISENLKELPWKKQKLESDITESLSHLDKLLGLRREKRPTVPHIAVLYAVGSIADGSGKGTIGAREEIRSRTFADAIRTVAADKNVKAIVLRVNSPGGSALASEVIWQELELAKKAKPIVVSMGTYAASGGYYISSIATKIYSLRTTLTGSIGVVGGKLSYGNALSKYGVKPFPITRGARAAMWSPLVSWSKGDLQTITDLMEEVYKKFTGRVAKGRSLPLETVLKIAQGRIWTGPTAKEIGLVDDIGTLSDAVAHARQLVSLPDAPLEIYPPSPTLPDILKSFGPVQMHLGVAAFQEQFLLLPSALTKTLRNTLETIASFAQSRVQTRSLLPALLSL